MNILCVFIFIIPPCLYTEYIESDLDRLTYSGASLRMNLTVLLTSTLI